jgi:glycosyltransferase involved in cell wall biosynthesis
MKIFHLIDSGGLYGAEQMLLALTEEQIKQGLEPIILSCGLPSETDKPLEVEAQKRNIPVIKWRMKSGLNFKGAWQILKYAKKEKVTILHSHGYKFNILFAAVPKFIRNIPFITTVHGYVYAKKYSAMWLYQIMDKLALRKADFISLVSPAMQLMPEFKKIILTKGEVVANGISLIKPSQKKFVNTKYSTYNLLAIGRLVNEKDFKTLISAVIMVVKNNIDVSLTIMGEGPLYNDLLEQIQKNNLEDIITLTGFVSNPSQYFDNFDMLVMSSTTEGVPITLLEAMRGGLPVISTCVGGIPWVLSKSTNESFLVEMKNPNLLAEAIGEMINLNEIERKAIIDQPQARFIQQYSSQVMAKNYHNRYQKLLCND